MNNDAKTLAIVNELAKAKSQQDIPAALAIYHTNAEMIAPSFNSSAKGTAEIERQLRVFFGLFPDYEVSLDQHAINGNILLGTGQVSLTLNIPEKTCPRITLPVFIEFHLEQSRVAKEVFSLDTGMICRQSGVSPQELIQASKALLNEITTEK